jgi:hypothetical protein
MHIDATGVAYVEYPSDYIQSLTKLRAGHEIAIANVTRITPAQLKAAGISAEQAAEVIELAAEHKKIGGLYEASAKMTEVLHDTYLDRGHQIATRIAEMVEQARRRADRSPNGAEILGPLDDLLAYQLGPAQQAAVTKAKAKAQAGKGVEAAKAGEEVTP